MKGNSKIAVVDDLSPKGFRTKTESQIGDMSEQELSAHMRDLGDWHHKYHHELLRAMSRVISDSVRQEDYITESYDDGIPF